MEIVLLVFIIFAVGMMAVTWFQANVAGGAELEDEIIRQAEHDDADYRLQNTLGYLQEAFFTSSERGSDDAASMSGRYQEDPEYRYWQCDSNPQPATVEEARNASSTFIVQDFDERINEIHGIRGEYIYDIGPLACAETGYYDPRDVEDNDHFQTAYEIEDVAVHREGIDAEEEDVLRDMDITREEEDVIQTRDILYNRYWFMYETLREWVEEERDTVKDTVREHMEEVPDSQALSNRMCIVNPEEECVFPEPYSCFYNHQTWLDAAVNDGLSEEMDRLETSPDYFNDSNVRCHVQFNEWRDDPDPDRNVTFPGHEVEPRVDYDWENTGRCCDSKYHGDEEPPEDVPDDFDDDDCDAYYHDCTTSWYLAFESYVDAQLICEDQRFNTVPREEELEHLEWRVDFSFTVEEDEPGDQYDVDDETECLERARPPVSYLPLTLNQCTFEDEALETCEVPVDTIGELDR